MFVRSLFLQRYGAFTGRSIDFGAASLSLVIGPNEAGKSTALDALSDLLWGIPRSSSQAFLYGRPALALQAGIDLPGGERIDVQRGSTGLSRVDTGAEVPPAWQASGDSRSRWRESFGLSHTQLREGGQLLCHSGGGDLAELIFTARSGRAVRELLAQIGHTADSLYKDHRGNKGVAVRQALADYEAAKEQVAATTAGARQVQEAREATEQAKLDVQRAEQRLRAARATLEQAEQRQHAAPDARRLAGVIAEVAQLRAAGALLDDDQLSSYEQLHKQLLAAEQAVADLGGELEQLAAGLSGVLVDEAVLADAADIRRLHLEAEARMADGQRADQLARDAAALTAQSAALLGDLVGDLGERTVPELLAGLHLPADRAAQLDALADELQKARQQLCAREEELLAASRRLAEADADGPELDVDVVAAVREAYDAIRAAGSAVSVQRSAVEAQADAQHRRAEALRLAGLPAGSPVPAVIPSTTAIKETADLLAEARTAVREAERQHARVQADLESTRQELAATADLQLPAPGALAQARDRRNAAVTELIDNWHQGRSVAEAAALPAHVQDAVSRADDVADQLLSHADAAARQAELAKKLGENESAHTDAVREHAECASRLQQLEQRWASLWPGLGIAVPAPADAAEVRIHLDEAHAAEDDLAAATTRAAGLQAQIDAQATALSATLARAGRPRQDADLDSLLLAAAALLADADAGREKRARLEELARLEQEHRSERERARVTHDAVLGRWRAHLRAAGIAEDLDETAWRRRRQLVAEARELQQRSDGLVGLAGEARRGHTAFLAAVQALAARHHVPAAEPLAAMATLSGRLDEALSAGQRAEQLDQRISELTGKLDGERRTRAEALEALARQRAAVGVPDLDQMAGAADRSRHARELADEAERLTDLVRAAAPGLGPETVVAQSAFAEPEILEEACAAARQELDTAEQELRDAVAGQAQARQRAGDLESGAGAAELHARAQEHLAVVAERAERYLMARIQSEVLGNELQAYERKHASPLLDEAGLLLERLTGGRYVALGVSNSAGGRGLVIIGADEERHAPNELSEGTADQVFLALRLAGIASLQKERQASGMPTLPVVFDDVLMTFDDRRVTSALCVMAELSRQWQIILFSHHAHLEQLAESLDLAELTVAHLADPQDLDVRRSSEEIRMRARTTQVVDQPAPAPRSAAGQPSSQLLHLPRQAGPAAASRAAWEADSGAIREWARTVGFDVGDRGRISADIRAAYEQAHR